MIRTTMFLAIITFRSFKVVTIIIRFKYPACRLVKQEIITEETNPKTCVTLRRTDSVQSWILSTILRLMIPFTNYNDVLDMLWGPVYFVRDRLVGERAMDSKQGLYDNVWTLFSTMSCWMCRRRVCEILIIPRWLFFQFDFSFVSSGSTNVLI